ncbi:nitroreductase family deazaflavin-dependent oxidoreductase [Knoellia aerolata]|uniref:nitroreductase family deazaflavin-dependent oxidoreductase n=1 Tax=Knoellia aerolata TaxID=442954 RepID=UPI00068F7308|nr:nitroreductase family deazaflavin-dependent oxidoreductase [Knoellia aerolata]
MSGAGLAADLGYAHSEGNPVHRAIRWFAGTRAGAWVLARTLRRADSVAGRLTGGRHSAPSMFTGIAVLTVTTTGRRSGAPRTSHLIATPYDGTLALIGTNFGQPSTPAWVLNLEADPRAVVGYRGVSRDVVARPASPSEVEEVFARSAAFYPGYGRYRHRLGGRRRVRVFVLEPPGTAREPGVTS